jgi:hypothetical protein
MAQPVNRVEPQGGDSVKRRWLLALLPVAATCAACLAFEFVARPFLRPSPTAGASLVGRDLPPYRVVAGAMQTFDPQKIWMDGPNPENVTVGDLWGILREDPVLGYVPLENARSRLGWWQSNNLGARSTRVTSRRVRPGRKRLLIFGESYGQASRVHQENAWFERLQLARPELELVNLCVDGYGMGQAYRRYELIRDQVDFDGVVFVFVPESDLWRDINTIRNLAEGWDAYTIMPRYVLEGSELRYIPGPYAIGSEIYRHDVPQLSDHVREHLRRYDRFYEPLLFEDVPILDRLVSYRLLARWVGERRRRRTYTEAASRVDSEAMNVTRRIFQEMHQDLQRRGKEFELVLLPEPQVLAPVRAGDLRRASQWRSRLERLQADGLPVVDLLPALRALPEPTLDVGYDGTHYGPRVNEALAEILARQAPSFGGATSATAAARFSR